MIASEKTIRPPWLKVLPWAGVTLLLVMQIVWLCFDYRLTYNKLIIDIEDAFQQARQKEQTYRIPVRDIVALGALTIQSCGNEELIVIRKCPVADTIIFDNTSGHSLETFINRAFYELREHILPLNIYCLSDLFAGTLHDKDIPVSFVIERFNPKTDEILETSDISKDTLLARPKASAIAVISETEALRANMNFSVFTVLGRMSSVLITTTCLLLAALLCFCLYWFFACRKKQQVAIISSLIVAQEKSAEVKEPQKNVFKIGQYRFDSNKNELQGFEKSIQLNKKENAILHELCIQNGNVVERNFLLEQYWGNNGFIYSRSLDTYIANLRKYLKEDSSVQITTIKGQGYKLVLPV